MNEIILALIALLSTVITTVLVPYIRSKTTKEQREDIYFLVTLAVQAAEKIYSKPGQGKDKKEYVIQFLLDRGIKIDYEELDILIESAVLELNIIIEKALE